MKKTLILFCISCIVQSVFSQKVSVNILYDSGIVKSGVAYTAEQNLTTLLTEVNAACQENRAIDVGGISMSDFARKAINMLWRNVHFRTKELAIQDRLWVFQRNKMMQVNHIPIIICDDLQSDGDRQDAVVEFDLTGRITDFRFAIDPEVGESFEKSNGSVAELEEQAIIRKFVDRLATAYHQKDIDKLNQFFSDDALIITGNVVTVRTPESGMIQKVKYSKQNKTQYLRNLQRCFARNKRISVTFSLLDTKEELQKNDGKSKFITHRKGKDGRNYYGVRLHQKWVSTGYSDEGYVFLLWEFPKDGDPIIHVRTWQPEMLNGKEISYNEIFSEIDFIKNLEE
jgi:hypothetical protein